MGVERGGVDDECTVRNFGTKYTHVRCTYTHFRHYNPLFAMPGTGAGGRVLCSGGLVTLASSSTASHFWVFSLGCFLILWVD